MIGREVRERARRIAAVFAREANRTHGPMAHVLDRMGHIASCVADGEYHRERLFREIVADLGSLGFDMSEVDTGARRRSETTGKATWNAGRDTFDLWKATADQRWRDPRASRVVDKADDLMQAIDGDMPSGDLDERAEWLHDAVTEWVEGDGKAVTGECTDPLTGTARVVFGESTPDEEGFVRLVSIGTFARERETPERVLFNPPATIAFWADGTKTVAKCSEGDEFSEYVGLLVCVAKRHLKVPRRGTFEDAMARLLKRAERQGGAHREP